MIRRDPTFNPLLSDPTRTTFLRKRAKGTLRKAIRAAFKAMRDMLAGHATTIPVMNVFCPGGKGSGKNPHCVTTGSTVQAGDSTKQALQAKQARILRQKRILKSGQTRATKQRGYRKGVKDSPSIYSPAKQGTLDSVANAFNPLSIFGSVKDVLKDLMKRVLPSGGWWKKLLDLVYRRGYGGTKAPRSKGPFLEVDPPKLEKTAEELARRAMEDIDNVATDIATKVGRAVDDAQRKNDPKGLEKAINEIEKVANKRAEMVVDDAVVRTNAESQLDGHEAAGVTQVEARVEWITMVGACPACASMQGKIFPLEAARGLIPAHPLCRCAWRAVS